MLVGLISLWTRPRWCSRPSAPERATARRRNLPTLDRKSTRLNSSHLGISYAVFCLKKKKELLRPLPDRPRNPRRGVPLPASVHGRSFVDRAFAGTQVALTAVATWDVPRVLADRGPA